MKKMALGKGLSALISDLPSDLPSKEGVIAEVFIEDIVVNTQQPRKNFDQTALEELAISIKENGLIQPIVVNPVENGKYQIIVGERRFRASKMANLTKIPVIIKKADDNKIFTWALLENIQREDLNAVEIAVAYSELMDRLNLTQEALAESLGKSRSTIANTLRLLKLPQVIQQDILDGKITEGHARAIASLNHIDEQIELRNQVLQNHLTVREAEDYIKNHKRQKSNLKTQKISPDHSSLKNLGSDISASLDLKVKIVPKDQKHGKIEIYYSDLKELERLKTLLTQQNKFWI